MSFAAELSTMRSGIEWAAFGTARGKWFHVDEHRVPASCEVIALRPMPLAKTETTAAADAERMHHLQGCQELAHAEAVDVASKARAAALLDEARRQKVQLLTRVGHELKTPLSAVLGFAYLMASDSNEPLTEGQRRRMQMIEEAGRHMLGVIGDVLDLASSEVSTLAIDDSVVPMDPVMSEVLQWMRSAGQEREITLDVHACPVSVRGETRHIRQIFINLASNAIKYNRRGGNVKVHVSPQPDSSWVCINVTDTGPGLRPEMVARLFKPFDRLGAERGHVEGRGIGLCIVRQLAERMGGRIEVRSELGLGSTFSVWLRAA